MNSKFNIVVSSASKDELLTETNAEIKYDKDTGKIKNKFIFLFSWKLHSLL